jgi:hypothetical protein
MKPSDVVKHYLDAYSRHDIDAIMKHLAEDCCVIVCNGDEENEVTKGSANMKQSYLNDWKQPNNKVHVASELVESIRSDGVGVKVTLQTEAAKKELDVTYVIRESDELMVKHIIHSIKDWN